MVSNGGKQNDKIFPNSTPNKMKKVKKNSTNKNNMVYIFKIILGKSFASESFFKKVKEPPYRVIAVLGRTTLYRLARAIIDAFGFRFDHLFGFYDNTKSWASSKIRYELNVDL